MKRLVLLLSTAFFLMGMLQSCNDCRGVDCQNGGTCNDGECDCLKGFEGESCEIKDLCVLEDVVCVFGECSEGDCFCNEGIELEDCSREAREKFIAKYDCIERVVGLDTIFGLEMEFERDLLSVPRMTISNIFNFSNFSTPGFFSRVEAIATPNTSRFSIPRQAPDDTEKEIQGSGSISASPDSTVFDIEIEYTVFIGNTEYEGTVEGRYTVPE